MAPGCQAGPAPTKCFFSFCTVFTLESTYPLGEKSLIQFSFQRSHSHFPLIVIFRAQDGFSRGILFYQTKSWFDSCLISNDLSKELLFFILNPSKTLFSLQSIFRLSFSIRANQGACSLSHELWPSFSKTPFPCINMH